MRAPSATFRREDYPDLQTEDQRDRFFRQLNGFTKVLEGGLSRGLTFGENFVAALSTVTTAADGAGAISVSFKAPLPGGAKPAGVTLQRAVSLVGSAETPASLGNPAWSAAGDEVRIAALSGGVAATRYRLTFLVIGG